MTETWDPWRELHGSYGSEILPGDSETSLRLLNIFGHMAGTFLGLIASLNAPNGGTAVAIILDYNISTIAAVPIWSAYYKAYI